MTLKVERWINEDTGRKTRKWYWEASLGDHVVGAAIVGSEEEARKAGHDALVQAAYVAGLCDLERPVGYIVGGFEHGRLQVNWDSEVHETRKEADESLRERHEQGFSDWALYALRPMHDEEAS